MINDASLKHLLEQIDPDRLSVANYSIEPRTSILPNMASSLIKVNGFKWISKYCVAKDSGYIKFGEKFFLSYAKELVDNLGLSQVRRYGSGPRNPGSWGGNWSYRCQLEPDVSLSGDFDLHRSWLRLDVTSQEELYDRVIQQTETFMSKVGIRKKE